jgi:hypothetical protein
VDQPDPLNRPDPATTDARSTTARTRSATVIRFLVGLLAAAVYLASGLLVLVAQIYAPGEGLEAVLGIARAVGVVVWIAIGVWLVTDWYRLRARVLAAAALAWVWAYLLVALVANNGSFGY